MKTKIFWTKEPDGSFMEAEMNAWFESEEFQHIEILEKINMTNNHAFWLVLFYTKNPTL